VDEQQQGGISVDLFREAARRLQLRFEASHAPNKRMLMMLEQGQVDVAVEVPRDNPALHYSTPFVSYSNVVLWQHGLGLTFRDWSDLHGRRVCAWQLAKQALGKAFAAARPAFAQYQEFAGQRDQVRLWLLGRCEVLVIDRNLVLWHLKELGRTEHRLRIPPREALEMAPVPGLSELDWYLGFRDAALRDRFNGALAAMRADGSYQRILNRHLTGAP
jgi:ABC-type amino acid transport substrate-binding protein